MQRSAVRDPAAAQEPDTYPLDAEWGPWGHAAHWHPYPEFLTAAAGGCVLTVGESRFDVTPERGVWIPRGTLHSARFSADFVPLACAAEQDGPPAVRALDVTAQLRRTLIAWRWEEDPARCAAHERTLLTHLTEPQPGGLAGIAVVEPEGRLTAPVAARLRRSPADPHTLAEWAKELHTSVASLRRAFLAETGMSYSQWRTRYRLNLSLPGLLAGRPVAAVAREVGFTPNGYTLAFRRHLGCAPSHFTTPHP